MKNIYGLTIKELEDYFTLKGEGKFKATQVFEWLYKKRIKLFMDMRNVSKKTIQDLANDFVIEPLEIIAKKSDIDVIKYLFRLSDDNKVEAVLMKHDYGNSLCISTQVGCNMGCHFCESGRLKKVRNLEVSEMVRQILAVEADLNIRISHLVLMGIGEPFDNYDNVISFIDIINTPKGLDLGSRHITISTCGIVPKIEAFMKYDKQVNLAISLHAPNNEIRSSIMEINKAYPLEKLIPAVKKYVEVTKRRVTFEYSLVRGENDSENHAELLSELLKNMNGHVNLIPVNPVKERNFQKSNRDSVEKFKNILEKNRINVTIRKGMGSDIDAACGQLRRKYTDNR